MFLYLHFVLITGIINFRKHQDNIRRMHTVYPGFLPKTIIEGTIPSIISDDDPAYEKAAGGGGCSNFDVSSMPFGRTVIANLYGSSDGVSPFSTNKSGIRCVMGKVSSFFSPQMNKTVAFPKPVPFIIGIYKGPQKNADHVLVHLRDEMQLYKPPVSNLCALDEGGSESDRIYAKFTAWIADGKERSYVSGTIHTSGYNSCPRCTQKGSKDLSKAQADDFAAKVAAFHAAVEQGKKPGRGPKKPTNHVFFEVYEGDLRKDEDWATYSICPEGQEVKNQTDRKLTFPRIYIYLYICIHFF